MRSSSHARLRGFGSAPNPRARSARTEYAAIGPRGGVAIKTGDVHGLVGRARELAELELALDRLADRQPWFVQIIGEPGIGKSRLLAELCRRGAARGYLVLDGRAAEFERDIPFGLIVDALNDYLAALEPARLRALDEDVLCELASIFPSLPRPDRDEARGPGEGTERYRAALRDQQRARGADRAANRCCLHSTMSTGPTPRRLR